MAWRLGINGYGRIGRCVVRALAERGLFDRIQPVLINDPADAESLVHLTHYDSTHGRSERVFQNDPTGGYLLNGRSIALTQSLTPSTIDYQGTPVDVVLESSGRFALSLADVCSVTATSSGACWLSGLPGTAVCEGEVVRFWPFF